jgi:hypothetical protein
VTKTQPVDDSFSVCALPKADGMVTLVTFKHPLTVKTTLSMGTLVEGVCVHCEVPLKFRVDELAKRCAVCSCEISNGQCLTGKGIVKNWTDLLKTLPAGTSLRVEYTDPNKPETGLKNLTVDRHKALLSVEGLTDMSPETLLKLGKSAGAASVERSDDNKRLQLTLKDDWTTEKESRWEKALAKVGAKIVSPAAQP